MATLRMQNGVIIILYSLEGIYGYDYADIYFHYRTWYIYVNVVSRLLD